MAKTANIKSSTSTTADRTECLGFVEALTSDGAALLAAVSAAPRAQVAACPGWDNAELAAHMGRLWHYVSRQVSAVETVTGGGRPPEGKDVVLWAREGLNALLAALASADPQAASWNWSRSEPQKAAFWFRRMAQETAVHRWDAEAAAGDPSPIPGWLAADGIEEFATMWLPTRRAEANEDVIGTAHIHASDPVDGQPSEWFIVLGFRGAVNTRHEHQKGDAVVRGTASDILLRLWGRPSSVEEFGDLTVLAALRAE